MCHTRIFRCYTIYAIVYPMCKAAHNKLAHLPSLANPCLEKLYTMHSIVCLLCSVYSV